ncbi:MAG: hypothetical protein JSU70_00425 [Phycisphaerales bacterium]|nr:MAG: hypothetical protein JSU70_00425 [Phycisphaerales bacterium]
MKMRIGQSPGNRSGSVLPLVVVSLLILTALGTGMLMAAYLARLEAIRFKNEAVAMMAAEAGYEKAVFWMGQQEDMLSALQKGTEGSTGTIDLQTSSSDYSIDLQAFIGHRPIYRVRSRGHSGSFNRTVDVLVVQAVSGWDMGVSRVLFGGTTTYPVYFTDGEVIDLPLHINNLNDNPDNRDIYITGSPRFLQNVAMGESRYTAHDSDKYASVIGTFGAGIYFDQPDTRITDEATIASKISRFRESTDAAFQFQPQATAHMPSSHPAVQLEFYVQNGVGKVRITNNATVRGYRRNKDSETLDFRIKPGTDGEKSERYDIYAYHFIAADAESTGEQRVVSIEDTYVTQSIGEVESEPGGQIYVDGNVVIGGDKSSHGGDQTVMGRITVVATGNIWIADSIVVDGDHGADGKPTIDNPNVLGLVAGGVIKVIDPGMSSYAAGGINHYPGPPGDLSDFIYVPVGRTDSGSEEDEPYHRHLPDPMIVEAAIAVASGGWGAENVGWNGYGGRKEAEGTTDRLIVRGSITEAVRGAVGLIDADGFVKEYYMDERFLGGMLPGDMWFTGKFIPAPAGWHDYRASH